MSQQVKAEVGREYLYFGDRVTLLYVDEKIAVFRNNNSHTMLDSKYFSRLEPLPKKYYIWVNIYPDGKHYFHGTEEKARSEGCRKTIKVEYEV